jgi:hypothetical protein
MITILQYTFFVVLEIVVLFLYHYIYQLPFAGHTNIGLLALGDEIFILFTPLCFALYQTYTRNKARHYKNIWKNNTLTYFFSYFTTSGIVSTLLFISVVLNTLENDLGTAFHLTILYFLHVFLFFIFFSLIILLYQNKQGFFFKRNWIKLLVGAIITFLSIALFVHSDETVTNVGSFLFYYWIIYVFLAIIIAQVTRHFHLK